MDEDERAALGGGDGDHADGGMIVRCYEKAESLIEADNYKGYDAAPTNRRQMLPYGDGGMFCAETDTDDDDTHMDTRGAMPISIQQRRSW